MNSINIPLAIAQGNYSEINNETIKVWSKTKVVSFKTATKTDVESGKAPWTGACYDYLESREEIEVTKPNWFSSIIVTEESLQKVAIADLNQRHQVIAKKHRVFQGKMAAGIPLSEKYVDNYLVFVYSKSAEYHNGERIYPEFYGLDSFYQFVSSLSDVEMLAAHSYAALVYSDKGYQSSSIDEIVAWCYKETEEEGFSFALVD
ncbi:hypothetical protein [Laspinema olomoucense]|uniref:hypothetical protein n=1 Tax=Laspinema olomoucense TaxID=3231600 RepID=UPI0021BACAA1|nr:hypothetical protein [Laspinema sp. D3d]MCT7971241.1 hypothetical protein [Laspinema sp. D3d]